VNGLLAAVGPPDLADVVAALLAAGATPDEVALALGAAPSTGLGMAEAAINRTRTAARAGARQDPERPTRTAPPEPPSSPAPPATELSKVEVARLARDVRDARQAAGLDVPRDFTRTTAAVSACLHQGLSPEVVRRYGGEVPTFSVRAVREASQRGGER
jgi:hypothetical protein